MVTRRQFSVGPGVAFAAGAMVRRACPVADLIRLVLGEALSPDMQSAAIAAVARRAVVLALET